MVKSINHVTIVASDVARSADFYEKLGLTKIPLPQGDVPVAWMGVGNDQVHIVGERVPQEKIDPRRPHTAFAVDDLEAAKAALTRMDIPFLERGSGPDAPPLGEKLLRMVGHQLWLEDPDGNMIELRQDYKR